MVGMAGLVVFSLLASCAEPAAPNNGKIGPKLNTDKIPKLELREGNKYGVTVNTDVEIYDKQGNVARKLKQKTEVQAEVVDGVLVPIKRHGGARNASLKTSSLMFDEEEIPDSIDMMPVLAITTNEYASSYSDTEEDSVGNTTSLVGSSSGSGNPVNLVNTYRNDTLVLKVSMVWQTVTGGYAMSSQIQKLYTPTGSIGAIVWSNPDFSTITVQEERSVAYRIAKSVKKAAGRAICALGPSVAYAATTTVHTSVTFACGSQIAVFAGETFVMGVASSIILENPWAIRAYYVGWGLWAHSLHEMLHCLR